MRVRKVHISNVLSFPYVEDINQAASLELDPKLNVIIGGNGSGKSTMLETINFIFRRVLFRRYIFEENNFQNPAPQTRMATIRLDPDMDHFKNTYRLNPNWSTENLPQVIMVGLTLDEVDKVNIDNIVDRYQDIVSNARRYSQATLPVFSRITGDEDILITVTLIHDTDTFTVTHDTRADIFAYLTDYEYIRELISIYNLSPNDSAISQLADTFTMLSAFRNYSSFNNSAVLSTEERLQIRTINQSNFLKSVNEGDGGEPAIFSVVRLRLASEQYRLSGSNLTDQEAEDAANNLDMLKKINSKLAIVSLSCSIKLVQRRSWSYSFEFYDTKHCKVLGDINSLSAGQRSIIHLIFEAYGRDEMQGGVVVIDEPEIHLHYQFQHEYLIIMNDIIAEQGTQYILVTHSDSFVNSMTAAYIKRFTLDDSRQSIIYSPLNTTEQRKLIEILDNTQSARALFGNKVLLVEGQDDRYFFRALLDKLHPELRQDISVYDTGSKSSHESWREFFEKYGIKVYRVKDLDAAFIDIYNDRSQYSLKSDANIERFKLEHPSLDKDIDNKYKEKLYILKRGALEAYTNNPKGLEYVISFCRDLDSFIDSNDERSIEVLNIVKKIKA